MTRRTDRGNEILTRHVGDLIERVERVRYFFGNPPEFDEEDGGELQFRFATGVVRLRVAADGEDLEVLDDAWNDPFAPPLTAENDEYVATHGAWRVVDVSTEPSYRNWIGKRLSGFLLGPTKVSLIAAEGNTLNVVVDRDELIVSDRKS